jgi:hypothetical protein
VANCLVLTKVDADLALSAERSTAQGRFVLPIFIRQGWPQAMIHLPWNHPKPLCGPRRIAYHRANHTPDPTAHPEHDLSEEPGDVG